MGMRKGVPHAKCSPLCAIKEKLQELWDRAYGCINKINNITPDGDGKFSIQAGSNIQLTEISNGLKIDTTGGVTYYTTTDPKLDIDNDALTIETAGVASQDDLDTVAGGVTTNANAISDIIDGTTTVSKAVDATNAAYIEGATNTIGSDTKPIKIVNGKAVPVTNDLMDLASNQTVPGVKTFTGNILLRDNNARLFSPTDSTMRRVSLWAINTTGNVTAVIELRALDTGAAKLYLRRFNAQGQAIDETQIATLG